MAKSCVSLLVTCRDKARFRQAIKLLNFKGLLIQMDSSNHHAQLVASLKDAEDEGKNVRLCSEVIARSFMGLIE